MTNKACAICLVMMLLAAGAVAVIFFRPMPAVVQTNLEKMPMVISGYAATEDSFSDAVYKELNADKHVYRHYKSQHGDQLDLYIGYYGTAKGGRTGHNPYACLPGAGSAIVDTKKIRINYPSPFSDVEVNYIQARKDGVNTVMVHWYQTAGTRVISTGLRHNIERLLGRLLHNRNDGAYVQITTNVSDDQLDNAVTKVQGFAGQVLQLLPGYWPMEK